MGPVNSESPGAIFLRFLRFGLLAWGGPVAQIAMIKRELVEDEGWVDASRLSGLGTGDWGLGREAIRAEDATTRREVSRPSPQSPVPSPQFQS